MVRVLILGLILVTLAGCRVSGDIEDLVTLAKDFKLSEIIADQHGIADNSTLLAVTVLFRHSDGSVEPNYTPNLSLISAPGVVIVSCGVSNAQGKSTCYLRSSLPGDKEIKVSDSKVNILKTVVFDPVPANLGYQFVAASEQNGDASGYKVSASIGNYHSSMRTVVGGYTVYSSVQGNFESIK